MKLKLALTLLLTATITFSYGQVKLESLKIDTSITGFHLAANMEGTYIYTKHGPADIETINPTAFSFTIGPNTSAETAKQQLAILLDMSKSNKYAITNLKEKDTTLNGLKAYYTSYTESDSKRKYKNFVFSAYVIKGTDAIIFVSGDLDNGLYIDKFKQTFFKIKL